MRKNGLIKLQKMAAPLSLTGALVILSTSRHYFILLECHQIIIKLMLEMEDDLIVISEECNFGFMLSEDEYSNMSIEYWYK